MAESAKGGFPTKTAAVVLLLAVNALLIGLNVSKHFDVFGSGSDEASQSENGERGSGNDVWSIDSALGSETTCDAPAAGDPIVIGYAADYGQRDTSADIPGVEAAVHLATRISCNGGVDGRPVQVNVVDVSEGADQVQDLIDGGAIAIIGPPFQRSGVSVLEVTGGNVPVLFASSTESSLADLERLSFLVTFDYQRGATAAAEFASGQQWTKAALFTGQQSDYYSLNPQAFKTAFESNGGRVVGEYTFLPGETVDFSESIDQFAADPPDVIYSAMLAPQASALRTQLAERGLADVEFIGADSLEASGAYFTPGLDGAYHATHVFPSPGGGVERLNASIEASSGAGSSSPTFAALAGDAMAVILDAQSRTGSDDPRVIADAITSSTEIQAVTGVLSYEGQAKPRKSVYIHQVLNGQPTLAQEVPG